MPVPFSLKISAKSWQGDWLLVNFLVGCRCFVGLVRFRVIRQISLIFGFSVNRVFAWRDDGRKLVALFFGDLFYDDIILEEIYENIDFLDRFFSVLPFSAPKDHFYFHFIAFA